MKLSTKMIIILVLIMILCCVELGFLFLWQSERSSMIGITVEVRFAVWIAFVTKFSMLCFSDNLAKHLLRDSKYIQETYFGCILAIGLLEAIQQALYYRATLLFQEARPNNPFTATLDKAYNFTYMLSFIRLILVLILCVIGFEQAARQHFRRQPRGVQVAV